MITAKLDTVAFSRFIGRLSTELNRSLRSAVNSASRAARTAAIKTAAAEIGVSTRKLGDVAAGVVDDTGARSGATFSGAKPGELTATWRPSRRSGNMGPLSKFIRGRPLVVKTHLLTRGSKTFVRSFKVNGMAFRRIGPGSHGSLKGTKRLNLTTVAALMHQTDGPVRTIWQSTAEIELQRTIPLAVSNAIAKAGA